MMKMKVVKETAKAVLVRYDRYEIFRKENLPEGARVVDETEKYALVAVPAETWLPKSQVKVNSGIVVEVAEWLRKDRGLYSLEEIQAAVRDAIAKIKAENPRLRVNWLMVRNELPDKFTHPNFQKAVRFYVEKFKEEGE